MIDGMQFWTTIFVYRHKTVLVSPWFFALTNDMLKAYKVAQV
jgi:hypothetical protein